jgi:hypothetical protein
MTRYVILAPRDRSTTPDLIHLIGESVGVVVGEIHTRTDMGRALDSLPRDPTCLYIDRDRGDIYRADPSGLLYKGDLLTVLGYGAIAQALDGRTYGLVTITTDYRPTVARLLAESLGCKEAAVMATLRAGGALELTRRNLVGLLADLIGLVSYQVEDALAKGEDPKDCRLSSIITGIQIVPQALCA